MSVSTSDPKTSEADAPVPVPKRITNAQTVCNERNEKGKLCNGHLKQLRTAGEPAEVHLRGDDVLFKCQTCGTLYMGPPLGHVRDPEKQNRFVQAELTALLQAAGGTLPIIKKNERGVFVMEETAAGASHAARPAAAKPAPTQAVPEKKSPAPAAAPTAKPAAVKGEAQPDRQLMRRYAYSGVTDTGPVPGESFAQKVERLRAVAGAAKRRSDEGGSAAAAVPQPTAPPERDAPVTEGTPTAVVENATSAAETQALAQPTTTASSSGPNRSLMRRSSYAGVVDTGPVPGETFAQKVERLRTLSAAAKQRSEGS